MLELLHAKCQGRLGQAAAGGDRARGKGGREMCQASRLESESEPVDQ